MRVVIPKKIIKKLKYLKFRFDSSFFSFKNLKKLDFYLFF